MAEKERVQKILAAFGVTSRRKAEALIAAGQVTVNGRRANLGDSADPKKDLLAVNGQKIMPPKEKLYLAVHKPRGFLTAMSDDRDRKCVSMLVESVGERVYPVGRLDKDSEGLLLFTNDGNFANMVAHPTKHIAKTYRVTVRPGITEEQLNRISLGIMIDGKMTAPAKVKVIEQQGERVVLEIVLYEGRNREIRKMCEVLGLEVARLKRSAIGPVKLGMLPQGKYRELTKEEIKGLVAEASKAGGVRKNDRNSTDSGQRGRKKASGAGKNKKRHR